MKNLKRLIDFLPEKQIVGEIEGVNIEDIVCDSRKAGSNSLFVAIRGEKADGHTFIQDALERGCRLFVLERDIPLDLPVKVIVPDTREALALLARGFFDIPDTKLRMIAVTGTNGKTTVTSFIRHIFESSGVRASVIGTLGYNIGDRFVRTDLTTPNPVSLFGILHDMVSSGVEIVAMEASSHSIVQRRIAGIEFRVAVFTNLSEDHLDYHGDMESYFEAKKRLFSTLSPDGLAIVNIDDPYGRRIVDVAGDKVWTYSLENPTADFFVSRFSLTDEGTTLSIRHKDMYCSIGTQLLGKFNIYNTVSAMAACFALGLDRDAICRAIPTFVSPPGRLEQVKEVRGTRVFIDYAHTPDALKSLLLTLKEVTRGRLIVVFGCGGDREKAKRPIMGKIAAEVADLAVVTSDNPRSEDPESIVDEITSGIPPKFSYVAIIDRREAIRYALSTASSDDIVVIAGKGHEDYQIFADRTIHFSDKEVVIDWAKEQKGKWNRSR